METTTGTIQFDPKNCSTSEPSDIACSAGKVINQYLLPVIVTIGFFANTFSFVIMTNSTNRKLVCCFLFAVLAVMDNVALISTAVLRISEMFNISELTRPIICKTYAYFLNSSYGCSTFLVTLISYKRYKAVCRIDKSELQATTKTDAFKVFCIVAVCFTVCIPVIFTSDYYSEYETVCIAYSATKIWIINSIWIWINSIFFFLTPLSLITYWNVRIILRVRRSKSIKTQKFNLKLTRMVVLISTVFVVLSLPMAARMIYFNNIQNNEQHNLTPTEYFFYHLTNKLFTTNHAINFYLYCLSSSKFRSDFISLWKKPCNLCN